MAQLMSLTKAFCDARAQEAASAAQQAMLSNVRERELRSEAAWRAMSDRISKMEASRALREAERAQTETTEHTEQPT
ncbi:hypothetical protein EDF59_102380 [Novosphingobium sp. ST904]|nr:hypothetical protein EDF59_102380 [Novosphingobium sp. ST904]